MKDKSKVAIVTGGARGIGSAIVMELASKGMIPVIYDLSDDVAKKGCY